MKKLFLSIAVLVVVAVVTLFLARNLIARKSVEVGVQHLTGFPLQIESVNIAPSLSRLEVRNLHLMNPTEFEEETFVLMPELTVDYKLGSMIKGAPHIHELVLDLAEVVIVKNAGGESNLNKLKGVASGGSKEPAEEEEDDDSAPAQYQVDHLRIHIGNVTIKDYSQGDQPSVRTMTLDIDAEYDDLNDSSDITRLVLITMMRKVRLGDFGIDTGQLTAGLGNLIGETGEAVAGTVEAAGKAAKGLLDSIRKAVPTGEE